MPTPANTDATADFHAALNDPTRWVVKKGVPIFKPHERTDPATGKLIAVDVSKLQRIADNMQRMERHGGVPIRMTLGHTEPGKPEVQQPPIGGYYRNARVATFGPKNEPAIVVDEWLDPQYTKVRKNFPYRSAEYYDDAEQITGVALLTRDPYLDLGVVAYEAYTRSVPGPVMYSRAGVPLTRYLFLLRDQTMNPTDQVTGAPLDPNQVPTATGPAPAQTGPLTPPATPYAQPTWNAGAATQVPTQYHGTWPGPAYNPHQTIPHPHTNSGANYSYGGAPPMPPMGPGLPGMGGPMPGGEEEAGLYALHHHLGQAVQRLSQYLSGGRRQQQYADPAAMGQQPMGAPYPYGTTPTGPTSGPTSGPSGPMSGPTSGPPSTRTTGYAAYNNPTNPVPTTISGLPVGYQLQVDQLRYQLQESNRAIQVLMYERDQADTEWCVSEIRRLAASGYAVGDEEVNELKARPREQREAYLQRIAARYQRIPTDMPPPQLGDPTPGPSDVDNRPATEGEMQAALRITQDNPQINYNQALYYARHGLPGHGPAMGGGPGAQSAANPFGDPYAAGPSMNGAAR